MRKPFFPKLTAASLIKNTVPIFINMYKGNDIKKVMFLLKMKLLIMNYVEGYELWV